MDFMSRVQSVVNQLKACGQEMEDRQVVEKVFRVFPSKYDLVAIAIENSQDLSNYSIHDLTGSLQSHEHKLKRFEGNTGVEQAFQMKLKVLVKEEEQ